MRPRPQRPGFVALAITTLMPLLLAGCGRDGQRVSQAPTTEASSSVPPTSTTSSIGQPATTSKPSTTTGGRTPKTVTSTTSSSLPPPERTASGPPKAFLDSRAGRVQGQHVASCWTEEPGRPGLCADSFGFDESLAALPARAGESLTLHFTVADSPATIRISRYTSAKADQPAEEMTVQAGNPARVEVRFRPGTHWLLIETGWPKGGVSYGFKISVE